MSAVSHCMWQWSCCPSSSTSHFPSPLYCRHVSCRCRILLIIHETLSSVAFMYVLWEHLGVTIYLRDLEPMPLVFLFLCWLTLNGLGEVCCHNSPVMASVSWRPPHKAKQPRLPGNAKHCLALHQLAAWNTSRFYWWNRTLSFAMSAFLHKMSTHPGHRTVACLDPFHGDWSGQSFTTFCLKWNNSSHPLSASSLKFV